MTRRIDRVHEARAQSRFIPPGPTIVRPIEGVSMVIDPDRLRGPELDRWYYWETSGGPIQGSGWKRVLPDSIEVAGVEGSYLPSVPAGENGSPDWARYFNAGTREEPMVYVWRPSPDAANDAANDVDEP